MNSLFLIQEIYEYTKVNPIELTNTDEISKIQSLNPNVEHFKHYLYSHKVLNSAKISSECEIKNVEYKLCLADKCPSRLESLGTQMNWRLNEGNGVCHYLLGVTDNGNLDGIEFNYLLESLKTITLVTKNIGAYITSITTIKISNLNSETNCEEVKFIPYYLASVDISSNLQSTNLAELRLAVIGNSLSGKSTLISILVNGKLDDGYGSARSGRFTHLHEEISGETSSTMIDIIGFDSNDVIQNYSKCSTMSRIVKSSKRIVAFIDLAGSPKYLRTTLTGITTNLPHYCLFVVDATSEEPLDETSICHLEFSIYLNIPIIIVINKVDKIENESNLTNIKLILTKYLKSRNLEYNFIKTNTNFYKKYDKNCVQIFETSCTTNYGVELFKQYLAYMDFDYIEQQIILNMYEMKIFNPWKVLQNFLEKSVFQIRKIYKFDNSNYINNNEKLNKLIVDGIVVQGYFIDNSKVYFGPIDKDGNFVLVKINSIQRFRSFSKIVDYFQDGGINFDIKSDIKIPKNGCFLLNDLNGVVFANSLLCHITITDQNLELKIGFRSIMHSLSIVKPVIVSCIRRICKDKFDMPITAVVVLNFENQTKNLIIGENFILRHPLSRFIQGKILQINPK